MNIKEITDQINVFFRPYCEALYIWQDWSRAVDNYPLPETIIAALHRVEVNQTWSRLELLATIERLLLEKGSFRWDELSVLRDALLRIAGISLETYLWATKKKKYRSIDDP